MEITFNQLQNLLAAAAAQGATQALIQVGKISPQIRQSEAYKLYGRARVDTLITAGKLKTDVTASGSVYLDRQQLISYFSEGVYDNEL